MKKLMTDERPVTMADFPDDDGSEAYQWMSAAPKQANGKVSILLLIEEGKRRGYCICPIPFRQFIDIREFGTHGWCEQPETPESWKFWYGKRDQR